MNNENYDNEMQRPPERDESDFDSKRARNEAQERAKKRPLLQKIANAIQGKKPPYTEIIVSCEPLERRVALLVDGILQKLEIERTGESRMVGAIFKGKIQNHETGLKAAFVDIGTDKNAFLHYWDILPPEQNEQYEIVRENRKSTPAKKPTLREIPSLYPIGTDIVVQIIKAQIGTKGPRTTTNVAIPGRYMVLMPFSGECGVSRKIEDPKERGRLKAILKKLTIPEGMGVIIRTAGEGKRWTYFVRDLHMLLGEWSKIQERMKTDKPTLLYEEPNIVERSARDFLTEEVDRILIDNTADYDHLCDYIEQISPRSKQKVALYGETIPIFERYNIERQIEQTFQRKVPLPSGGEIVIDETEALTAIDVNTGAHKNRNGDRGGNNVILQVNLEAAKEIARQVRLRNIGGLLVIDFIDMKQKRDRNTIYSVMRREMSGDRAKTHVLPLSQLGLMQISRQRHSESNARGIYTQCPYCGGKGIVKSPRTLSVEIQRRVVSILKRLRAGKDDAAKEPVVQMRILCHPTAMERIREEDETLLLEIEKHYNAKLSFRADPAFHAENFKVLDAASGAELR